MGSVVLSLCWCSVTVLAIHFSRLLDTKFMSTAAQFKELITSNVLGHMRETLSEAPFQMPVVGKSFTFQ